MKKIIKWFFRFLLILIGLIIILLIVIPMFFKDAMLAKVKEEINNNVNAKVEFVDFKLSLFKSFPDLNLGLHEVSVKGIDQFEGDTLVYFESFNVQINLISAIKKNVVVKGIVLNKPFINGKVLEDSTANWDITKPVEEISDTAVIEDELVEVDTSSETMDYRVDLQKFQIKDAKIKYLDETSDMIAVIDKLNFLVKGDLGTDYSDISINTSINDINVKMGGIKYLKNAKFGFDATIGADMDNMIFTFKENVLSLNDIALGFEGVVEMLEEDINVDVKFGTKKTSFKSLLSMVPAIYLEGFEELKTSGNLALSGKVKGTYNESQMPLANLRLVVEDAMFQYPDLPKSVENVNIDVAVFYDGVIEDNTKVDLNKFHVEVADNPFDIALHIRTPFSDPYIEGSVDGHIILNTLTDVLPLEDMSIDGEITADIDIAGNMSTIENENYDDFKATGQLQLKDFVFESADLPAAVKIIETTFNFTPQYLELKTFKSEIGESDFNLNGKIENYIAYALSDGILKGDFNFKSSKINANEFMTETTEEVSDVEVPDTSSAMNIIEIPKNIDFKLVSTLDHIIYDQMDITDLTGTFLVKDQKVMMNNLKMKLLDGYFGLEGEYNTQNMDAPSATMGLDIRDIEIESALNSFSMLEKMAPILKHCKGKVSIKFDYTSLLDSTMSPVLNTMDGYGKIHSKSVQVVDSKTLDKLGDLLKMGDKFNNEFKDVNISFKIKDGRINVEPFDLNVDDIKMTVGGSHGVDQTMDYNLVLDVPRKYFGSAANNALEGLLAEASKKGVKLDVSENIKVKAKVIGTTTDPKITLNYKDDTGDAEESLKDELKKQAKEEIENKGREELEAEAQKIVDDAEKEAAKIKREAREQADKLLEDGNNEADALVKKASKEGYLAKVAAEATAKKLKAEAKKKADNLVKEADKKADKIVADARIKADNIKKEE
ncbi:MAG: AsmA family protein [Bacteroidales bacterium]|nr:AsmA family protein [Bacteroidales bacterium]